MSAANPFLTYLADGSQARLPKRPPGKGQRAIDVPTFNWFTWDTLSIVQQAIQNLEFGIMREGALLWDWMLRDDRMSVSLSKRFDGLLGSAQEFEPANETAKAIKIADDLKAQGWKIFPTDQLYETLRWGRGIGVSLAQNVYEKRRDRGYSERIQVWHPQFLYWDWTARLYYVVTQNRGNVYIEPDDPEWFLYTPYGMQLGWQKSLVRALFMPWLIRQFALRDWARFSEVHGKPMRKAKFPSSATPQEKDDFFQALAYISSELVIRLPNSKDPDANYDVELLEAKSETWEGIKELKKDMDDCIAITINGNNLTTDQKSGSLAATKQHAQQQSIFVKADGESLSQALHNGPIRYWAAWNYPNGEKLVPWMKWQTDPPEDMTEKSTVTLAAAQALQIFKTIMAPLDERAFMELFSLPLLDPGAQVNALPDDDPDDPQGENTAPDTGDGDAVPVIQSMLSALSAAQTNASAGQAYLDRVAKLGTFAASESIRKDLLAVLTDVRRAKTPADLKARLKARFRGMDPAPFAKVLKGALVVSNLAGRAAARR